MRIVVLFPGALGDLCLLAPALSAAIAAGARIELCVQRSLVPVARMLLPTVEIGPPMDGAGMSSLFGAALDPALARRLTAADRIHAWLRGADGDGALTARFAALRVTVALHAVPRDDAAHHVSLDYAEALGLAAPLPTIRATAPPVAIAWPWRGPEPTRLVLHPGAGASGKAWMREGFAVVAAEWRRAGGDVLVLLGPAEDDQADAWGSAGYEPIVGRTLGEAAALIASAPAWLGNDSGMSHVAAALDRRGIVLFGPTRPARWRPRGGRLVVVEFRGRALDDVAREVLARLGSPPAAP